MCGWHFIHISAFPEVVQTYPQKDQCFEQNSSRESEENEDDSNLKQTKNKHYYIY